MSRIGWGLAGAASMLALLPAGASAGADVTPLALPPAPTTVTTPTTPTTTPAPAPKPKPARGRLKLSLAGVFHVGKQPVTTTNRAIRVNGTVRPYIPGQVITVHAFVGHKLIHSQRVRPRRSRGGTFGHFSIRFASNETGGVSISAVHPRDAKLERLVANSGFAALHPSAGFGSTGRFVELIQGRLALLHFYVPQTGVYDNGTGLAIDAYHRLRGWGTSQNLDDATIAGLLDGTGSFKVRNPRDGKHAEGDLSDQLLALIDGSRVFRIYPISSGKPSTPTVLGHFSVYSKVPGYLPDGMYYSNFFYGGYAIHGYDPAPDYPASHGCMRLPIVDATSVFDWLDVGNDVDVYYT